MAYFSIILFIFLFNIIYCEQRECKNEEVLYHVHLGTKSAYRFLANLNDTRVEFPGCNASQIWMLVRHGTRYPGTKKIKKMDEVLSKLKNKIILQYDKGTLCDKELKLFEKWKLYPKLIDDKNLAHEGEDEMIDLAERMQNRFPNLFPQEYDNNTYYFRYTATQRCTESARHFAIGLFGRKESRNVWFPDPLSRDPILRFYKLCDKWRSSVKKNIETYYHIDSFEESVYVQKVQDEVADRLGFDFAVSVDELRLMYTACGFETAWSFRHTSPWCLVFTQDNFKVLEYLEDLKYYWVDGHGHELTKNQACVTIKDLIEFFDSVERKTVVYFAHSGTVLKVLSHLGLYQDEFQLQHDNYDEANDRLWKVSRIDPFGSNLAFVLFDCEDDKKIMLMHQERQVFIPGCPQDDLCPLETFKEIFHSSIHECNFDEMCSVPQFRALDNEL